MAYRGRHLIAGLAVLALVIVAAFFASGRLGEAGHGPIPSMEVDPVPAGNSADAIGPTEPCFSTFGGPFNVDIIFDGAPALSRAEFDLSYGIPGGGLALDAITHEGLFFGKNGGPVTSLSDPAPDETPPVFHV